MHGTASLEHYQQMWQWFTTDDAWSPQLYLLCTVYMLNLLRHSVLELWPLLPQTNRQQ